MTETVFQLLSSALGIWEHEEKNKYLNQYLDLQKRYYEALNAPDVDRSDAVIDDIERQLRLLAISWCTAAGKPNSGASA